MAATGQLFIVYDIWPIGPNEFKWMKNQHGGNNNKMFHGV